MSPVPELVSVIIPSLNPGLRLAEQLVAVGGQDYRGRYEVIVADNGSRDGSLAGARSPERVTGVPLQVLDASSRRGPGAARNDGAQLARGELLAFCDADDVVSPGWLRALVASAAEADLVGGRWECTRLNSPEVVRCFELSDPRRPHLDFLPASSGGNLGVWRDVFAALGGFDEDSSAGEDVDLVWRAQLAGYRFAASDALVHKRLPSDLGDTARRFFGYGQGDAWLYSRYGAAGMPRRSRAETVQLWRALARGFRGVSPEQRRKRWVIMAALSAGRLVGSARRRVLFT